jgi:hypothetical protein
MPLYNVDHCHEAIVRELTCEQEHIKRLDDSKFGGVVKLEQNGVAASNPMIKSICILDVQLTVVAVNNFLLVLLIV